MKNDENKRGIINSYNWIIIPIVILILIDQISKIVVLNKLDNTQEVIPGILNFTLVKNTGGAFGLGEGNIGMFIISNIVILGVVIKFMIFQKERIDQKTRVSLGLILAGGIANFFDRLFYGFVIDFLDISPIFNFPKFNLADIYICIRLDYVCFIYKYIFIQGNTGEKEGETD